MARSDLAGRGIRTSLSNKKERTVTSVLSLSVLPTCSKFLAKELADIHDGHYDCATIFHELIIHPITSCGDHHFTGQDFVELNRHANVSTERIF